MVRQSSDQKAPFQQHEAITSCRLKRQSMTDRTLGISAALREAQLQRLEASLASKPAAKPQARVEAPKDKDEPQRD